MSYIAEYTRPYEGGYKNRPSEETPEMAEFINKRDDTLLKIESFLKDLDLSGLGSEYALLSEAGYSFDVSMDDYYVLTISLKNKAGDVLSSKSVDLPIESMIIDVDYADGVLILTLQNGNTVNVSIIDIVRGLVPETRKIAGIDLKDDITAEELKTALDIYDSTVMGGELKPWLYDTSGEEVLVGVYGGKPLYRKSIELNMTIITHWVWHNTGISCDEMETVVNGFAIDENGQYYPAYIEKTRSVNKISFAFGATIDDRVMKMLVIEYTKTTDAEGSGNSLTPYGIFNAKLDGIEEAIDAIKTDLGNYLPLVGGKKMSGTTTFTKGIEPGKNSYMEAPIVFEVDGASENRSGIGFHNKGVVGAFVYFSSKDLLLHIMYNSGNDYIIPRVASADYFTTKDFSSEVTITSEDERFLSYHVIAKRWGNVRNLTVTLTIDFGTTPFGNGESFDVNIKGIDFPLNILTTNTFLGTNDFAVRLNGSGLLRVRNLSGGNITGSSTELSFSFTYIV